MQEDPIVKAKQRLADRFWLLIARRYPLTDAWWRGRPHDTLFAPWSPAAFDTERDEWLRLVERAAALTGQDAEIDHWGRFARVMVQRLEARVFKHPAQPVRLANTVAYCSEMLYPGDSHRVALMVKDWLPTVSGVVLTSPWQQHQLQIEASRLKHWAGGIPNPDLRDATVAAIDEFVATCPRDDEADDADLWAWVHSAHVTLDTWRKRQQEADHEPVTLMSRPIRFQALWDGSPARPEHVVNAALTGWWLRPQKEGDVLITGSPPIPNSHILGIVLAAWRQRSGLSDLSWLLTPPPILAGGLAACTLSLEVSHPNWEAVLTRFLSRWQQQQRALAIAESRVWAAGHSPREVGQWLSRYVGSHAAQGAIPRFLTEPGFHILAWHVKTVLARSGVVWSTGPVMPYEVFVSPEGTAWS